MYRIPARRFYLGSVRFGQKNTLDRRGNFRKLEKEDYASGDVWSVQQSDGRTPEKVVYSKTPFEIRADEMEAKARSQIKSNEVIRQKKKDYLESLSSKVGEDVIGRFLAAEFFYLTLLMAQWVDTEAEKPRIELISVRDHHT